MLKLLQSSVQNQQKLFDEYCLEGDTLKNTSYLNFAVVMKKLQRLMIEGKWYIYNDYNDKHFFPITIPFTVSK